MGIGIEQYRMRVGLFAFALKYKRAFSLVEVFCFCIFVNARNKQEAFSLIILLCFIVDFNVVNAGCKECYMSPRAPSGAVTDLVIIICILFVIIEMLLIISGIHPNPGPSGHENDNSSENSFSSSEYSHIYEMLSSSVSFLHLNVQSLLPKLDLLSVEYNDFDILSFTESWLNDSNDEDSVELLNFQTPFRKDRVNKKGGGVIVYVKNTFYAFRRIDLEIPEVEVIWIQVKISSKSVLYGTFYVPPQSGTEIWDKVESSIESAVNDVNCDHVIITGDFNDNQQCINSKMKRICTTYSLDQMIEDPTNFTEHSSTIIDLIITSSVDLFPYTGVMPSLLDE